MRPARQLPGTRPRYENDLRAKVFDTFTGGFMVTGVKVYRRPVKLWLASADGGALATLTLTPLADGSYRFELLADDGKTFDMQGLGFETAGFTIRPRPAAAGPLAEADGRSLDLGAITTEEAAAARE